jgi:hypothetical protein
MWGLRLELWWAIEIMRWQHVPHAKANGCDERALDLTGNEPAEPSSAVLLPLKFGREGVLV